MSNLLRLNALRALALFFLICLSNLAHTREFVTPGLVDYPPYTFYTESGGWQGYSIDLAKRLIRTPNNEHQLGFAKNLTWSQSINSIRYGKLDFLWEVSYTAEREEFMEFVGVTDVERMHLLVPKTAELESITELDDFYKVPVAADRGSISIQYKQAVEYSPEFKARLNNDPEFAKLFFSASPFISSGSLARSGSLIALGRISASITSESAAIKAQSPLNKVLDKKKNVVPLKSIPIHAFGTPLTFIVIPKVMPDKYKKLIYENYAQARADGSFDKIWNKWFAGRATPPNRSTQQQ